MKVTKTKLPGVLILEPKVFEDERGFFVESWNQKTFEEAVGEKVTFVQDNHSMSKKGVLRGLHYQKPPHEQGKLVRVVRGKVFDVAVDINPDSPTFKQWVSVELSDENHKQIWIPGGYAHGFLALSEDLNLSYKTTAYYCAASEKCIKWDFGKATISWPLKKAVAPLLSFKDLCGEEA
jgi:dTDP-4-dehydrorhamnose 3,5-epimerase